MEIRKVKKEELKDTMDLAWNVFLKFEAPDYYEEGIEDLVIKSNVLYKKL